MRWESFPVTLTPLTPLHIGDGSQLEAYEYTVVDGRFYRLSLDRLLPRLSPADQDALDRFLERDLVGLRGFVRAKFSPDVAEYQAAASPQFRQVYEAKLGEAQNQLIVFPFFAVWVGRSFLGLVLRGRCERRSWINSLNPLFLARSMLIRWKRRRSATWVNDVGKYPTIP